MLCQVIAEEMSRRETVVAASSHVDWKDVEESFVDEVFGEQAAEGLSLPVPSGLDSCVCPPLPAQ